MSAIQITNSTYMGNDVRMSPWRLRDGWYETANLEPGGTNFLFNKVHDLIVYYDPGFRVQGTIRFSDSPSLMHIGFRKLQRIQMKAQSIPVVPRDLFGCDTHTGRAVPEPKPRPSLWRHILNWFSWETTE